MRTDYLEKLAKVIVEYCLEVKEGEFVQVKGEVGSLPLIKEVYKRMLLAGGNPRFKLNHDDLDEIFFKNVNDKQIKFILDEEISIYRNQDGMAYIESPTNTKNLSKVDPSKQALHSKSNEIFDKIFRERTAKDAEHFLKWIYVLYPCEALAQDLGVSLDDYTEVYVKAMFLDKNDPIEEIRKAVKFQHKVIDYLKDKSHVKIIAPDTELELSIQDRYWVDDDGKNNLPCGEVFTCPVPGSVNGYISFSYPAIEGGREVDGVRLVFKDGIVVEETARSNEYFLVEMLNTDEGARKVGEFAFGLNDGIVEPTKHILFDEKIGRSLHLALGFAYPDTGDNFSSIHWDMLLDLRKDAKVLVDDVPFIVNGKYMWEK